MFWLHPRNKLKRKHRDCGLTKKNNTKCLYQKRPKTDKNVYGPLHIARNQDKIAHALAQYIINGTEIM